MLISFSIENWMSFRDRSTISMIATSERQHKDHVPNISKYKTKILPIAAIYGGNASGKTNLFKALRFAQKLIVEGTQPDDLIPVEAFRLDTKGTKQPSHFIFELLINEYIYEFSFIITKEAILEEKLIQITSTSEKILYHRQGDSPNFNTHLQKDKFLQFAFKGTRNNQLFLTNSVSQKVEKFRNIYNWFKNTLELVAPDSRFGPFEQFLDNEHPLYTIMNDILPQLDTGIINLGGEEIPFENVPLLNSSMRSDLQKSVTEGKTVRMWTPDNECFVISRKNGEMVTKKLVTYHPKTDGTATKFEIRQESDGTQRIINLLPAFLELSDPELNSNPKSNKVYVIDEIDRSLHTLLLRQLLEIYLSSCCASSRSQLLLTTHDVLLMDQKLLRRDEMWVTERDVDGVSTVTSFSEYKDVRNDKDIRKSYLQGRLGGIPHLILGKTMAS